MRATFWHRLGAGALIAIGAAGAASAQTAPPPPQGFRLSLECIGVRGVPISRQSIVVNAHNLRVHYFTLKSPQAVTLDERGVWFAALKPNDPPTEPDETVREILRGPAHLTVSTQSKTLGAVVYTIDYGTLYMTRTYSERVPAPDGLWGPLGVFIEHSQCAERR